MTSLQNIIKSNNLNAEILSFNSSTHTVEDAAVLLKCNLPQIVKSLVVIVMHKDETITPFLVLVSGNRKLRQTLVRKLLTKKGIMPIKDSKLASPQEVEDYTGYSIGGVPPLIDRIETIIDEKILEETVVYGGGGNSSTLLKILVKDLVSYTNPITGVISKKMD